jgi:replicative DNA helicase
MTYLTDIHRPLPQATDAEKGLLGSMMLAPSTLIDGLIHQNVDATYFHHPAHGRLFDTMVEMRRADRPVDMISLTQYLEDKHLLEEVGGAAAITELFTFVPTSSNAFYYLEILREKQVLRDIISTCGEFSARAYNEQGEAELLAQEADARFTFINEGLQRKVHITREALLIEYIDEKEAIATGKKQLEILRSPLQLINDKMGGYTCGEETIIMGPTNSGKSMLGMEHILVGALDQGYSSGIWTGEMPHRQYMDRIISNRARISSRNLRMAKLDGLEQKRFFDFQSVLNKAPLEIFDQKRSKLTLESIEREIRLLKKKTNLRVVLIDYLQKLNFPRRKDVRPDEEIAAATSLFKSLAIELDLWVFVLSSTNDEGQVKGSRGPEYDADNILSVIINQKTKQTEKVHLTKCRDGEKGYLIDVHIDGDYCTFAQNIPPVRPIAGQ